MQLSLEKVSKSYGQTRALVEVSLVLEPGIHALLGPNGAGKTTLMQLIVGNLKPDRGEIRFEDQGIASLGARYRARIGFMPQQQKLYDSFTLLQFLSYIAALKGLKQREAAAQIERLLADLNLSGLAARRLGACSGGMLRRVLLAQALLGEPDLLILDEPTAGLDPAERVRVKNHIAAYAADRIVMLATHVVSDVEAIAHRVLLLNKGRLIGADSPAALLAALEGQVGELRLDHAAALRFVAGRRAATAEGAQDLMLRSLRAEGGGWVLRLLSGSGALPEGARRVAPDLEDLYMLHFGNAAQDLEVLLAGLTRQA